MPRALTAPVCPLASEYFWSRTWSGPGLRAGARAGARARASYPSPGLRIRQVARASLVARQQPIVAARGAADQHLALAHAQVADRERRAVARRGRARLVQTLALEALISFRVRVRVSALTLAPTPEP